jgi:hypothetical protein
VTPDRNSLELKVAYVRCLIRATSFNGRKILQLEDFINEINKIGYFLGLYA